MFSTMPESILHIYATIIYLGAQIITAEICKYICVESHVVTPLDHTCISMSTRVKYVIV